MSTGFRRPFPSLSLNWLWHENPLASVPTVHEANPQLRRRLSLPLFLAHEVCGWEKTQCQALWCCTLLSFSEWLRMRRDYSWFATLVHSVNNIGHFCRNQMEKHRPTVTLGTANDNSEVLTPFSFRKKNSFWNSLLVVNGQRILFSLTIITLSKSWGLTVLNEASERVWEGFICRHFWS